MLNIYILAGGKSTRMGEEKGLTLFHDKPLIQYVIETAELLSKNIFICTANQDFNRFNYPLVEDQIKGLGPAGAIDTILQQTTADYNLVLGCDMPFIDIHSLQFLINQCTEAEITVPIYNHYPEALMAVYAKTCQNLWHDQVELGILKLSDLISHFKTNFDDGNKMSESNPSLFKNINSKEDLLNL